MLNVPFDRSASSGIIYLWIGSKATEEDVQLANEVAKDMTKVRWFSPVNQLVGLIDHFRAVLVSFLQYHYTMQIVKEGEEPDNFFWNALGGKQPYETVWPTCSLLKSQIKISPGGRCRVANLTPRNQRSPCFTIDKSWPPTLTSWLTIHLFVDQKCGEWSMDQEIWEKWAVLKRNMSIVSWCTRSLQYGARQLSVMAFYC